MRYAGIIKNDFSAAPGTCVTFFTQGCPHHCAGCHNPETWDFNGGKIFDKDKVLHEIFEALKANGVHRDLCIMGGEPLCPQNIELVDLIVSTIKVKLPDIKIYIWTGYTLKELYLSEEMKSILTQCEAIIDGRYIKEQRDITLPMRGSRNQKIIYTKDIKKLWS